MSILLNHNILCDHNRIGVRPNQARIALDNSLLIEIKKYDGKSLEEDFERGPFLASGVDAAGTSAYYADPAVMYAEKN